jgi:hypothetical protein
VLVLVWVGLWEMALVSVLVLELVLVGVGEGVVGHT